MAGGGGGAPGAIVVSASAQLPRFGRTSLNNNTIDNSAMAPDLGPGATGYIVGNTTGSSAVVVVGGPSSKSRRSSVEMLQPENTSGKGSSGGGAKPLLASAASAASKLFRRIGTGSGNRDGIPSVTTATAGAAGAAGFDSSGAATLAAGISALPLDGGLASAGHSQYRISPATSTHHSAVAVAATAAAAVFGGVDAIDGGAAWTAAAPVMPKPPSHVNLAALAAARGSSEGQLQAELSSALGAAGMAAAAGASAAAAAAVARSPSALRKRAITDGGVVGANEPGATAEEELEATEAMPSALFGCGSVGGHSTGPNSSGGEAGGGSGSGPVSPAGGGAGGLAPLSPSGSLVQGVGSPRMLRNSVSSRRPSRLGRSAAASATAAASASSRFLLDADRAASGTVSSADVAGLVSSPPGARASGTSQLLLHAGGSISHLSQGGHSGAVAVGVSVDATEEEGLEDLRRAEGAEDTAPRVPLPPPSAIYDADGQQVPAVTAGTAAAAAPASGRTFAAAMMSATAAASEDAHVSDSALSGGGKVTARKGAAGAQDRRAAAGEAAGAGGKGAEVRGPREVRPPAGGAPAQQGKQQASPRVELSLWDRIKRALACGAP